MKKILGGGLLLLLCALTSAAHATCSVRAPLISLGAYDPLNPEPPPVLVSIQVSCTQTSQVAVSAGKGSSRNYDTRTLVMGPDIVNYNLYTGTNQAVVWGDGTFGTRWIQATVNANEPTQITGNASIYPGQNPRTGFYSDTLIFTVNF